MPTPAFSIRHGWGFPGHGLYAASAGCRGGISDNTLGGLIAKSLDRQGNTAFYWPASPGGTFLGKAGFIDIAISNQLPHSNSLKQGTSQQLKHTH